MKTRRGLLCLGVLGVCAVAPSRVRGATEVEGVGYVGESPGGFSCGPSMRAKYAGGAARVRVAENDKRILGSGFSGELAGSVARERYAVTSCNDECDRDPVTNAPIPLPEAWMGGGHLHGAYSNDNVSVTTGVTLFNAYDDSRAGSPTLYAFPDFEFGAGVTGSYRILAGFGTPNINSLRHPGAYLGADVALGAGELQARFGAHRSGPGIDTAGARLDLTGYLPLVPKLDLRVGLTGVEWNGRTGAEGSIGVRAGF